jgi:hypothetical protein
MIWDLAWSWLFLVFTEPQNHYCVHGILPLTCWIHSTPSHLFTTYFNIILPTAPRSPQWDVSVKFSDQNLTRISHLLHAYSMPNQLRPPQLEHPNNNKRTVQTIKLLIRKSLHLPVTFLVSDPNTLNRTLFLNTHDLRSLLISKAKIQHMRTKFLFCWIRS